MSIRSSTSRWRRLVSGGVAGAALVTSFLCCAGPLIPTRPRKIILIGIDGGDLTLLRQFVDAGKLPNLKLLLERGAAGRLASIYAVLPFSPRRGGGYWSPLVWTSIVTGRTPDAHGIIDFRLPHPDHYRICTEPNSRRAVVRLPARPGARGVRLQVDSGSLEKKWSVRVGSTGELLIIPESGVLDIGWNPGSPPPDPVRLQFSADAQNPPPVCLISLDLLDSNLNVAGRIDFVGDRGRFESGWGKPVVGKLRSVGPDYRRVRAIWSILNQAGHRVAVVGWRDSWPAERVDGYYVSDRLGWRPARADLGPSQRPHLTYPPELTARAQSLVNRLPEVDQVADRTLLATGTCELKEQVRRVAHLQYSGDWLRHSLAIDLWDADDDLGFLAVYYSGIDGFGHLFANHHGFREGSCRDYPPMLERYYQLVDEYLGDWIKRLSPETTLFIVTDHGMVVGENRAQHIDNGFTILVGPGVHPGAEIDNAHVLDVTPTILYLMGCPLALDMTGVPLWNALEPRYREAFPPRQVATHETARPPSIIAEPVAEDEAEMLERLRALGYIN